MPLDLDPPKGSKAEAARIERLGVLNDRRLAAAGLAGAAREAELREIAMEYQKLKMLRTATQVLKEV